MKRRLSYAQSLKAPPYQAFYNAAHDALTAFGQFSHEGILKETGYDCLRSRDIHWRLVVRRLEENGWGKLVPASGAFFKKHAIDEEIANPSKFLAGAGKGQYIAGYFKITQRTEHLVGIKLKIEEKIADVAEGKADNTRQVAGKVGLHLVSSRKPPLQGSLPLIENPSEAKAG